MTRPDLARVLVLYVVTLIGATALWVALFHTPLLDGSVLFYRGLLLLLLVAVLVAIFLGVVRRTAAYRGLIGIRDVLLILSLLLCVNVLFFTHVPVTADRSISVYILAYMNRAGGPLTKDQIADNLIREYVVERDAIGKRVEEQLVTGTLVPSGDGYVISDEGRSLIALYELIARAFNIETSNLAP